MKKALLFIPLLALAGCGNAVSDTIEAVSEARNGDLDKGKPITTSVATVEAFTKIASMGPDHIVFRTGDAYSIVAQGPAEAVGASRYVIEDGRIAIGRKKDGWKLSKGAPATIIVTAPSISALALAGSGDVTADKVDGDDVKLSLAGSGDLKVSAVAAKDLKATLAGTGNFSLAGKAENADYSIAGSGMMDADALAVTDAEISIAGSGDANVNATGKVKASIAGSGNVHVRGGATCSSSSVGSGKVHCG